jgi:hypothetical protein
MVQGRVRFGEACLERQQRGSFGDVRIGRLGKRFGCELGLLVERSGVFGLECGFEFVGLGFDGELGC